MKLFVVLNIPGVGGALTGGNPNAIAESIRQGQFRNAVIQTEMTLETKRNSASDRSSSDYFKLALFKAGAAIRTRSGLAAGRCHRLLPV